MNTDAVFLFTFSPVQTFILESRRTADLKTASTILVTLARAAAEAIQAQGGVLVYPSDLTGDVPNKLAAEIEWQSLDKVVDAVNAAFIQAWDAIQKQARQFLNSADPRPDPEWNAIWDRQAKDVWEQYWSAAKYTREDAHGYAGAYQAAQRALDARKRTRAFSEAAEPGEKDTLSGRRQALTIKGLRSQDYWSKIRHPRILPSDIRAAGRERLDALGAVKRFCDLARASTFPSTSALAARTFSEQLNGYPQERQEYVGALEALLDKLRKADPESPWPYDGDLLYIESLTKTALEDNYILPIPKEGEELVNKRIAEAAQALKALHRAVGEPPNTYYAILALDGDNMGATVDMLLRGKDPRSAHERFSQSLAEFSKQAKAIIEARQGSAVYIGGDDVLALVPLREAVFLSRELADAFHLTTKATCSAGLAIVHHTYPLGAALAAAREAEKTAKHQKGKDTLCVRVLKRSGEITQMMASRAAMREDVSHFEGLVELFMGSPSPLSGRLPYTVMQAAAALPLVDAPGASELKRLVERHTQTECPPNTAKDLAEWAGFFEFESREQQMENLARWLALARFIAQGGRE